MTDWRRSRSTVVDVIVCVLATAVDWSSTQAGAHVVPYGPRWIAATGVALAGLALLLARRSHPLAAFVAAWLYGCSRMVLPDYVPVAVPLVALHALTIRSGRPRSIAAAWSLAVPFSISVVLQHDHTTADLRTMASGAVVCLLLAGATWLLGQRERQAHEGARLAQDSAQAASQEAVAAERRRIARELHDSLGHSITAMSLQAAGALAVADAGGGTLDPTTRRALQTVQATGGQAMRDLHALVGLLRDETRGAQTDLAGAQGAGSAQRRAATPVPVATADDVTRPGLRSVGVLIDHARASGLSVRLMRSGDTPVGGAVLDPRVDAAAYRVVQEAVANAMRHDGRGSHVHVRILHTDGCTFVTVRSRPAARRDPGAADPGLGSGGYGLRGLRERVLLAGGDFSAGFVDGEFVTSAVLPDLGPDSGTPVPAAADVTGLPARLTVAPGTRDTPHAAPPTSSDTPLRSRA